jgi:hypothetical protein
MSRRTREAGVMVPEAGVMVPFADLRALLARLRAAGVCDKGRTVADPREAAAEMLESLEAVSRRSPPGYVKCRRCGGEAAVLLVVTNGGPRAYFFDPLCDPCSLLARVAGAVIPPDDPAVN